MSDTLDGSPNAVLRGCRGGSPWASPIPPRQLEIGAGEVVRSMHLLRITAVFPIMYGWKQRRFAEPRLELPVRQAW